MAERLKEFYSGTLTAADIVNGNEWVIIANGATSQAVVKDVVVNVNKVPLLFDGSAAGVSLKNNGYKIGRNVTMTGYEIVDTNAVLKFELETAPTATLTYEKADSSVLGYYGVVGTTTIEKVTGGLSNLTHTNPPYSVALTDLALIQKYFDAAETTYPLSLSYPQHTVPYMNSPNWVYMTATHAYYFYYDGNSTTLIYRADVTGGVVGAWTNIQGSGHSYPAIDHEGQKIYWVTSTTLYEYDMVTLATTNLGATGRGATSSYTSAGFCNGAFFWFSSNSDSTSLHFWRRDLNTFGTLILNVTMGFSSYMSVGVAYNPDEDRYYFDLGYSTNRRVYYISGNFAHNWTAYHIGYASNIYSSNGIHGSHSVVQGDRYGRMFIIDTTNAKKVYKMTGGSTATLTHSLGYFTSSIYRNWFMSLPGDTPTATTNGSDYAIEMECKVSGVEITEVV